jgi:hypothetical protein
MTEQSQVMTEPRLVLVFSVPCVITTIIVIRSMPQSLTKETILPVAPKKSMTTQKCQSSSAEGVLFALGGVLELERRVVGRLRGNCHRLRWGWSACPTT